MTKFREEIGSEFWLLENLPTPISAPDNTFVYSGRTAIDLIIRDIQKKKSINTAYLPAYSCDSMIQPFIERGIKVVLYDVYFENSSLCCDIQEDLNVDVFYVCNYFGYDNNVSDKTINNFRKRGATIIYDQTHSLFCNYDATIKLSDYTFASIRKWIGVISGAIVSRYGKPLDFELKDSPHLSLRQKAMIEKGYYMQGNKDVEKDNFLKCYSEFNKTLANDYRNYRIDSLSYSLWLATEFETIKLQRHHNAEILHSLSNVNYLGILKSNTCPIFVPIFFESKEQRDTVQQTLTNAEVYCPIHWAKNSLVTPNLKANKLFDTELSLVCDQRYNETDMQRIISLIKPYLK